MLPQGQATGLILLPLRLSPPLASAADRGLGVDPDGE